MKLTSQSCIMAVGFLLGTCSSLSAADDTKAKDIDCLIDQLGSPRFKERERASRELSKFGVSALASLKAASNGREAEVRRRAQQLVEQIERPLQSNSHPAQRILSPKSYL